MTMTKELMNEEYTEKVKELAEILLKQIYSFVDNLNKEDEFYVERLSASLAGISGQIRAILFNIANGVIRDSKGTQLIFKSAEETFARLYEQQDKKNVKK